VKSNLETSIATLLDVYLDDFRYTVFYLVSKRLERKSNIRKSDRRVNETSGKRKLEQRNKKKRFKR